MKTLKDLFGHEIQDIYSAEKQLKAAFPEFISATDDKELTNLLEKYQEQTNNQFDKIRKIADDLDINPGNSKCEAMEGLIKEAKGLLKHDMTKNVKDAGIIARVQRIMHYEISAYGTAVRYAKELDMNEVSSKLQDIVDEKLGKMAKRRINEEAIA